MNIELHESVSETIIHARKKIYEALLSGVEPVDILKEIYGTFLKSGCYDAHQLIQIFSNKDLEMANSTEADLPHRTCYLSDINDGTFREVE